MTFITRCGAMLLTLLAKNQALSLNASGGNLHEAAAEGIGRDFECVDESPVRDYVGLLQRGTFTSATESIRPVYTLSITGEETCADLKNEGTYFSVAVTVGTPEPGTDPQTFDLVADTGSSAVIVTSCVCVEEGLCSQHDKCFTGTNKSATFDVPENSTDSHGHPMPTAVGMTFGSGTVNAVIASDEVHVGGAKVMMKDGLLLMVDRTQLKISGTFEGILGLGVESKEAELNASLRPKWRPQVPATKLFLKEAGIDRFSLCFNDAGAPGALRLDLPPLAQALPAIGTFHWGLSLTGLSVGNSSEPTLFCDPSTMKQGQTTPCAMIPDSGTTLLMGPAKQIQTLFGDLCDKWERCKTARSTGYLSSMTKSHAFQTLLYNCSSWMSDSEDGINEVPSIFLTVGGNGESQVIELTAWAYITETMEYEYNKTVKHLFGIIPVEMSVPTGKLHKVCVPSFGVQDYDTIQNGPVWIMGTPLFYQFTVGYDLSGPSISFTEGKCSMCNETDAPTFLSSRSEVVASGRLRRSRALRRVSGIPRTPDIDTSLPL
jgi:hypothetical protein